MLSIQIIYTFKFPKIFEFSPLNPPLPLVEMFIFIGYNRISWHGRGHSFRTRVMTVCKNVVTQQYSLKTFKMEDEKIISDVFLQ